MTVEDYRALLARVEGATGAYRELDIEIGNFLPPKGGWYDEDFIPEYTDDIDAALALVAKVLPGWEWLVRRKGGDSYFANIHAPDVIPNEGGECFPAIAASPALAILAALLAALIAQSEEAAHAR